MKRCSASTVFREIRIKIRSFNPSLNQYLETLVTASVTRTQGSWWECELLTCLERNFAGLLKC